MLLNSRNSNNRLANREELGRAVKNRKELQGTVKNHMDNPDCKLSDTLIETFERAFGNLRKLMEIDLSTDNRFH